jgi:16S rRNA (cytosine1402-N4)-methyltransferase
MQYHQPVLLDESIDALIIRPDGRYIDATFGGGGHAKAILNKLSDKGHLFVFDQDEESRANLWEDARITFVQCNFRYLRQYMMYYHVAEVHGILADLGVSSWQLDQESRGFSYRSLQPLDMRMNRGQSITAADILHRYDEDALIRMFSEHGEIRNAKTLVAEISKARATMRISNAGMLQEIIAPCIRGNKMRYLSQVFQALRIEVNAEDAALREFLEASGKMLCDRGRLVIISYHSGEDRLVKQYLKQEYEDDSGRKFEFLQLNKKPVTPDDEQIKENIRARSALMRIAEKTVFK